MAKFSKPLFIAYANDNQYNTSLVILLQDMGLRNTPEIIQHYSALRRGSHKLEDFGSTLYSALFHLPKYRDQINTDFVNFQLLILGRKY